jgi:hypothetical protein
MKIKKQIPEWFIIADTKLNQQTFMRYIESSIPDFEEKWIKANGKAQNVAQSEKMLDAIGRDFSNVKTDGPTNEVILKNFSKLEPLFEHFTISILFSNASHKFIESASINGNLKITKIPLEDLSIWLPPQFESTNLQNIYGQMIGEIFKVIDTFTKDSKANGVSDVDVKQTALSMMPLAQQSKALITGTITEWRKVLLQLSAFEQDAENRFISLQLCRDLKMRYLSFFYDFALETIEKKQLGLDSLNNEGFWKTAKLIKKPF